ncbi:MAG: GyrI-like domain-containing protein [Actinomycetes bacterium]
MATKSTGDPVVDALYKVRKGKVEFVDVPELAFATVVGGGAPGGDDFHDALQALYSVSYGAHFALKKTTGQAPRVMGLEALWWVEGAQAQAAMQRIATGEADMDTSDRDTWRWQAMIMQLPPIDEALLDQAIAEARVKKDLPALGRVKYVRWTEGRCAQIMHVGPYETESVSVVALHRAIADNGYRPRGKHHEIYLGDPRTSAPERLRTILRQPVEPTP